MSYRFHHLPTASTSLRPSLQHVNIWVTLKIQTLHGRTQMLFALSYLFELEVIWRLNWTKQAWCLTSCRQMLWLSLGVPTCAFFSMLFLGWSVFLHDRWLSKEVQLGVAWLFLFSWITLYLLFLSYSIGQNNHKFAQIQRVSYSSYL